MQLLNSQYIVEFYMEVSLQLFPQKKIYVSLLKNINWLLEKYYKNLNALKI